MRAGERRTVAEGRRNAFNRLLAALVEACHDRFGDQLVSLAVFGSVGRGTPRPDSDVDLFVVVEGLPRGRLARMELFEPVERSLASLLLSLQAQGIHTELSPVLRTPQAVQAGSPLMLDMVEDARILWDRGSFLEQRLGLLRRRSQELGARRIPYGGGWYWDLKPDFHPGEVVEL